MALSKEQKRGQERAIRRKYNHDYWASESTRLVRKLDKMWIIRKDDESLRNC